MIREAKKRGIEKFLLITIWWIQKTDWDGSRVRCNGRNVFERLQVQLAQFPVHLEIEPELRPLAKGLRELHGHIRADAAPPSAYLIDRFGQHPDVVAERGLGVDAQGLYVSCSFGSPSLVP